MAKKINEVLNNPFSFSFCSCSLWSVIFLCLSYVYCTLLAPQILYRLLFSNPSSEDCIFPKGYEHNTLCKIWGTNRVHYGGFENSQWEGGACTPVAPLPHYSPLRSHGIFLASHKREFWSRKYPLRVCISKTALWLKGFISFEFFIPLQNLLSLFDRQSNQALVEAFQNVGLRGFKLETFNSVHYLTNLRSTLLVTSRISCYEVAFAGLSVRRDAAKIELARSGGGCGPRAFFASLFTVPLYHYLGAWNRLVIM